MPISKIFDFLAYKIWPLLFAIDIFILLNTGYYENAQIVHDRKKIFKVNNNIIKYIRKKLFFIKNIIY